jgi:hypothetical protein
MSSQTSAELLVSAGNVVGKGDFRAQVEQVFKNLKAALEAAGQHGRAGFETGPPGFFDRDRGHRRAALSESVSARPRD